MTNYHQTSLILIIRTLNDRRYEVRYLNRSRTLPSVLENRNSKSNYDKTLKEYLGQRVC